ncbi:MAG: hypothetical protein EHM45_25145 [Desulfobacteraceae bacterium]|nr:MAG: hypothetical protein EHM45_25145 [Desulfobacteraceae bacterium]
MSRSFKCPKCGAATWGQLKCCPHCGQSLLIACPDCGKSWRYMYADEYVFCPDCGAKMIKDKAMSSTKRGGDKNDR